MCNVLIIVHQNIYLKNTHKPSHAHIDCNTMRSMSAAMSFVSHFNPRVGNEWILFMSNIFFTKWIISKSLNDVRVSLMSFVNQIIIDQQRKYWKSRENVVNRVGGAPQLQRQKVLKISNYASLAIPNSLEGEPSHHISTFLKTWGLAVPADKIDMHRNAYKN